MFLSAGSIPSELGQLANLKKLVLYGNQLSGACKFGFCRLCVAPDLHTLSSFAAPTVPENAPLDEDGDMFYDSREKVAGFQRCL